MSNFKLYNVLRQKFNFSDEDAQETTQALEEAWKDQHVLTETKAAELVKQEIQPVKEEVGKLSVEVEKLSGEVVKLNGRMDNLENRMDGLETRMDRLEVKVDDLKDQYNDKFAMLKEHMDDKFVTKDDLSKFGLDIGKRITASSYQTIIIILTVISLMFGLIQLIKLI